MYEKAESYLKEHITRVSTYDEFKEVLESKGGFIKAPWCGETSCEEQIKSDTAATTRCISDDEPLEGEKCICCSKEAKYIVNFAKAY